MNKELINILKQVAAYCEDQAVYDKLSKYGDFYYKIKQILENHETTDLVEVDWDCEFFEGANVIFMTTTPIVRETNQRFTIPNLVNTIQTIIGRRFRPKTEFTTYTLLEQKQEAFTPAMAKIAIRSNPQTKRNYLWFSVSNNEKWTAISRTENGHIPMTKSFEEVLASLTQTLGTPKEYRETGRTSLLHVGEIIHYSWDVPLITQETNS